jgi:hypothetical protein
MALSALSARRSRQAAAEEVETHLFALSLDLLLARRLLVRGRLLAPREAARGKAVEGLRCQRLRALTSVPRPDGTGARRRGSRRAQ